MRTLFLGATLACIVLSAQAQDATVDIKDFMFGMNVTIPRGSTVTWRNLDGEPHTVVSPDGLFRSPALDEGDRFTFRFEKPGVYVYICSIHPRMTATVTVR